MVSTYDQRQLSYGSYSRAYRKKLVDLSASKDGMIRRIELGIQGAWKPDASGAFGAARRYHPEETGANLKLAEIYSPIICKYLE